MNTILKLPTSNNDYFSYAPKWVNWYAVNSKGTAYWFERKPLLFKGGWHCDGVCKFDECKLINDKKEYQNSLVQRL